MSIKTLIPDSGTGSVRYALCRGGMEVHLITRGAALCGVYLPDRGRMVNVLLAFQDPAAYCGNTLYAGAVVGPNAGRIAGGQLPLDSQTFQLEQNEGKNNLHGGSHNLSFSDFTVETLQEDIHADHAIFSCTLPDGLAGFPGERRVRVRYTLDDNCALHVFLEATSTKDTYLNLSTHPYFNLSGDFTRDIYDHALYVAADHFAATDCANIPQALLPVAGTPFDFRTLRSMQDNLAAAPGNPQIEAARGYDHGFLLHPVDAGEPSVILSHPASGRQLRVFTQTPAVVLYSGGYIGSQALLDGQTSCDNCALAIECQDLPDVVHNHFHPVRILRAAEPYRREFTFAFTFPQ